ncbi:MAG TPA: bifunctional demethylmenaquinone methyltransferase/2-methoxy-6-polyprenyl-1,4-benzoquinol methylase UbiE [Candidatus Krumholzibacteria bacterium]|nr:bifunctional demethylmenaquinone methyltransferase/2-methoxy-6-polyprenyl-1,4-benzoquinol methylase UbiE [Candidatus Krumholzibacteria bacterium]
MTPTSRKGDVSALVGDKRLTPTMFDTIARRYDLVNHVLSLNIDRRWRQSLVYYSHPHESDDVLDVATGTGDVAIAFAEHSRASQIAGVDLSDGMLGVARDKIARLGLQERIALRVGDALDLPYSDGSFDIVTIAFGLRNLPDYQRGVNEMARVLKPRGRAVILEFLPPRGVALLAYRAYLSTILPLTGRLISGSPQAYRYLASSVRQFISEDEIRSLLHNAGLSLVVSRRLTGGIAGLYRGVKS